METTINGIESKESAEAFAKLVGGSCNVWFWNAWVEK